MKLEQREEQLSALLALPLEDQGFRRFDERAIDSERADTSDPDRMRFQGIAGTNGEASDGHILSIAGLEVPERQPLLFGHQSYGEVPLLGSATEPKKTVRGRKETLRMTGEINLRSGGENDSLVGVRVGIAAMVADGDLQGLSLRWTPTKPPIRRVNLPRDHPAFVPDDDDTERRWGVFFPESIMRELSIVALGADPAALIGRSEQVEDPIARAMLRAIAQEIQAGGEDLEAAVRVCQLVSEASVLLRGAGLEHQADALVDLLAGLDSTDSVRYRYLSGDESRSVLLPRDAWQSLVGESRDELRAALELRRAVSPAPVRTEPAAVPASTTPVVRAPNEASDIQELARTLVDGLRIKPEQMAAIAKEAIRVARGGDA